jgi:amicyanin
MRISSLLTSFGLLGALAVAYTGASHAGGYKMYPPGYAHGPAPYKGAPYARMPMQRPMMRPYGGPMRAYPPAYGKAGYAAAPAASAAPAAAAAAVESAEVTISRMQFSQPTVTIKKGGTVTWQNAESMPHTVTASDGSFGSRQLQNGDVFSMTFDEAGTYSYYCSLHPMMRGTVVVEG